MKHIMVLAVLCLVTSASCAWSNVEVKREGRYRITGTTTDVDSTIRAASDAVVNETYADAYSKAVENGQAYPYPAGPVGDYSFYGFDQLRPPAGGRQQMSDQQQGDDAETKETAEEALRRANDALRMHKKLRQELSGSEGGK